MSKLEWDKVGEHFYETGVRRGVIYPQESGLYPKGYAWNGLTAVTESPSGAEPTPMYANNSKYLNLLSAEEFAATVEAYTYPDEFAECDGSANLAPGVSVGQQKRKTFGLSYQTLLGNDVDGNDHGYKLHIIYGALAAPSEKAYNTVNDSPEAVTLSWELSTTPVSVADMLPTASVTIDSTKVDTASSRSFGRNLISAERFTNSVNIGECFSLIRLTYCFINSVFDSWRCWKNRRRFGSWSC